MIMTLMRGAVEIISLANNSSPKSFKDFTGILIGRKRLSSATVSKRLKDLVAIRALEEVVIRSKAGRRIIGYCATERGRRILEIAKELEQAHKNR